MEPKLELSQRHKRQKRAKVKSRHEMRVAKQQEAKEKANAQLAKKVADKVVFACEACERLFLSQRAKYDHKCTPTEQVASVQVCCLQLSATVCNCNKQQQ